MRAALREDADPALAVEPDPDRDRACPFRRRAASRSRHRRIPLARRYRRCARPCVPASGGASACGPSRPGACRARDRSRSRVPVCRDRRPRSPGPDHLCRADASFLRASGDAYECAKPMPESRPSPREDRRRAGGADLGPGYSRRPGRAHAPIPPDPRRAGRSLVRRLPLAAPRAIRRQRADRPPALPARHRCPAGGNRGRAPAGARGLLDRPVRDRPPERALPASDGGGRSAGERAPDGQRPPARARRRRRRPGGRRPHAAGGPREPARPRSPPGLALRGGERMRSGASASIPTRARPAARTSASSRGCPRRAITGRARCASGPTAGSTSRSARAATCARRRTPGGPPCCACSLDGSGQEIYATGLRNSVGFDWRPATGELFATDNGRDLLGDDFPPCELNRITPGGFYGWPYANGDNRARSRLRRRPRGPDRHRAAAGPRLSRAQRAARHRLPAQPASRRRIPRRRPGGPARILEPHAQGRLQGRQPALERATGRSRSATSWSASSATAR